MTTTTSVALPEIVEPDLVILLAAITAMYSGTVAGGAEEVPGLLVHFSPQVGGLTEDSAKPLNDAGADPPESEFSFHHPDPHHWTSSDVLTVVFLSPITNEPWASTVGEITVAAVVPLLPSWFSSPP